jgi:catechol 2,3-dioxygenase-like lactoylglutathione lyase family enzyme
MKNYLGQIALLVNDYNEAIEYYVNVLGFRLVEDTQLSEKKRWVVIEPRDSNNQGCKLLLAKASNDNQLKYVGNQSGGRVFLFLYTTDFDKFHSKLMANSVEIVNEPRIETYGKVLVFRDLYGNLWDLIQPF